jgi:hypothetical protein
MRPARAWGASIGSLGNISTIVLRRSERPSHNWF